MTPQVCGETDHFPQSLCFAPSSFLTSRPKYSYILQFTSQDLVRNSINISSRSSQPGAKKDAFSKSQSKNGKGHFPLV